MSLRVLIPVASADEGIETTGSAQRSGLLDGATVGIMYNSKPRAPELLGAITDLLRDRFEIKEVVGPVRTAGIMLPTEEQLDEMAAVCDVVLVGLGDCSSCSALSSHVAIDFERRGVPAVAVGTKPFVKSFKAMGVRQGFPDFQFVTVEHPISSLDPDGIRDRALEALPQVLSVLGVEDRDPAESRLAGTAVAG